MALAQTGHLDPPLILSVDSRYSALGGTSTFTLQGPPGARFALDAADVPAESVSGWGVHFLDLGAAFRVGAGFLSPDGETTVVVTHPDDAELDGMIRHFQARAESGSDRGLSASIGVRFSAAPGGGRAPQAIAVTPDGQLAYVAHERDGTVSIIDAVADSLLFDMPVSPMPRPFDWPLEIGIDPEGRHVFVVDPRLRELPIIDAVSGSIAGHLPVPPGCRSIAFHFAANRQIFVTNERDHSLLLFKEAPLGTFTLKATIPLEGRGPGPIAVLGDKTLLIGHRQSLELERVRTTAPIPTITRIPLGSMPFDVVASGRRAFVTTFTSTAQGDGHNELLEVDLIAGQVVSAHLQDLGTDYFDAVLSSHHLVLLGSASGTLVVADPDSLGLLDVVDLAPGERTAMPRKGAIVPHPVSGSPKKLYVVNRFRETVRPVDLNAGAPFPLLAEIPLAYSGLPRVPMVDLTDLENGEYFFGSVEFFNGDALNPNRVSCATCHPHGLSDGINHLSLSSLQAQALFDAGSTSPFAHDGSRSTVRDFTSAAFNKHGVIGGELDTEILDLTVLFQEIGIGVPVSPFLEEDGTLSDAAEAGQLVFEGAAACSSCHTAPIFIPVDPEERTIELGVGTGLAPANVPSLRGLWATAPYFHDGSAAALMDVLLRDTDDQHGTTSTLTQQELDDLVAYLLSL